MNVQFVWIVSRTFSTLAAAQSQYAFPASAPFVQAEKKCHFLVHSVGQSHLSLCSFCSFIFIIVHSSCSGPEMGTK